MPEVIEDSNKCNSILCVAFILLLIFVGGDFALILPTWVWILFALFLVASLYRSLQNEE